MAFLTKENFLAAEDNEPPELSTSQSTGFSLNARPGGLVLPVTTLMVNNYARIHGLNDSLSKALLMKDAGCCWKEDAGPDIDFSDCRLATHARGASSYVEDFAMTLESGDL